MQSILKLIQNLLSPKSKDNILPANQDPQSLMQKQIQECRDTHDVLLSPDVTYFALAEPAMDDQWNEHIYPNIKDFDLSICLELAPGHGRNTNKLRHYAKEIHLVDVNKSCIDACRQRFGEKDKNCSFFYYVNDGHTLKEVSDNSIQFIYSWDAVVHFDKLVVKDYVNEFFRIMGPSSYGFIHHSNYGNIAPGNQWMENPGWRSNMTAELFVEYCNQVGLHILKQQIINNDLDCISIFSKP
jgi:hypothetical protein